MKFKTIMDFDQKEYDKKVSAFMAAEKVNVKFTQTHVKVFCGKLLFVIHCYYEIRGE